jgi:DNA-directed RNA polymerase subunit L
MQKINIKLIPVSYENKLGNSCLKFKLIGDCINYVVANTIRRVMLSDIPIFAFDEFKFEKNTSVFHNNYMICRIKNMPIWGVENKEDVINDLDNLKQITMYVNSKNKTNEIVTISTDDVKFYYNGKLIKSPYEIPIPIIKLQPEQEISFSAVTRVGTEEEYASFSACNVVSFKYENENEFEFNIESSGQLTEKRILHVAVISIIKKLENFMKLFKENATDTFSKEEGSISINDEDHTLGNLVTKGMQQHPDIEFAGYHLPHPLSKKVIIDYKLKKNVKIKNIINDVVVYYTELFEQLDKHFKNLK